MSGRRGSTGSPAPLAPQGQPELPQPHRLHALQECSPVQRAQAGWKILQGPARARGDACSQRAREAGTSLAPPAGRGRPARRLRALAAVAAAAVLVAGCSAPFGKPSPGERGRETFTQLAGDARVQRAFARGRGEVIARDPEARRAILGEVIVEQRRMLDDPALRDDYLELNARITREASTDPDTQPLMLENTVDLLERVPDDPELRRRLVNVMRELLKDPAIRADMMAMMQSMMQSKQSGSMGSGQQPGGGAGSGQGGAAGPAGGGGGGGTGGGNAGSGGTSGGGAPGSGGSR